MTSPMKPNLRVVPSAKTNPFKDVASTNRPVPTRIAPSPTPQRNLPLVDREAPQRPLKLSPFAAVRVNGTNRPGGMLESPPDTSPTRLLVVDASRATLTLLDEVGDEGAVLQPVATATRAAI